MTDLVVEDKYRFPGNLGESLPHHPTPGMRLQVSVVEFRIIVNFLSKFLYLSGIDQEPRGGITVAFQPFTFLAFQPFTFLAF